MFLLIKMYMILITFNRPLDHVLGAEHGGRDRLDGGDLDQVDVLHRRGVDDDVDVGHRIPEARCVHHRRGIGSGRRRGSISLC